MHLDSYRFKAKLTFFLQKLLNKFEPYESYQMTHLDFFLLKKVLN